MALTREIIQVALTLGCDNDMDAILNAIANLKHSLELSQKEVEALQKSRQREDHWREKYNELQVLYDQAWQDSDLSELRSERDYYRSILDKLCDRLNVPNIEALEHAAKYQEMDLDFTAQYNDDLRQKLAESQAMALKYMNRIIELEREVRSLRESIDDNLINKDGFTNNDLARQLAETQAEAFKYMSRTVELENEVRSLQEPVPTSAFFLSTPELVQIIRRLLD